MVFIVHRKRVDHAPKRSCLTSWDPLSVPTNDATSARGSGKTPDEVGLDRETDCHSITWQLRRPSVNLSTSRGFVWTISALRLTPTSRKATGTGFVTRNRVKRRNDPTRLVIRENEEPENKDNGVRFPASFSLCLTRERKKSQGESRESNCLVSRLWPGQRVAESIKTKQISREVKN